MRISKSKTRPAQLLGSLTALGLLSACPGNLPVQPTSTAVPSSGPVAVTSPTPTPVATTTAATSSATPTAMPTATGSTTPTPVPTALVTATPASTNNGGGGSYEAPSQNFATPIPTPVPPTDFALPPAASLLSDILASFHVLAGSTVTNTGPSDIIGNAGVSPGSAITGFPPGVVEGTFHAADAVAAQAQTDLSTSYGNLVGRLMTADMTGQDLGGLTLTPGVYSFSSNAQLTGALTLDATTLGSTHGLFIFQIANSLTTAMASSVALINGAQANNVYWQVGGSATLGSNTAMKGNILADLGITLTTGASLQGRALARNLAVTLDTNPFTAIPVVPTVRAALTPFLVLAGTTVTNAGATTVANDLGVSPGTLLAGFPPGIVRGTQGAGSVASATAQTALTEAYDDLAARSNPTLIAPALGGDTLPPGIYATINGTMTLNGNVTLDATSSADPANAVFILQVGSTLTTSPSSHVLLAGGAQAKNVFWQVGSSAHLGASSSMEGNVLALTSITLDSAASLHGRVLARNGAVVLDTNTITAP